MSVEVSARETYGKVLVELGRENGDIVVLDSDLSKSTMTHYFASEFPGRFFDCGIAEQNTVGIAAGLAASGKVSFVSTFAVFASGRCYDQVRMSIAQPHLNVKIVATHGGVTVGEDGCSHHSIEDLALMTSFPGFTVVVPADANEAAQVVRVAAETPGPFYIRLGRPKTILVYGKDYRFCLGKAVEMRQGSDITVIATGIMVASAIEAADRLVHRGINCRVLSMPTIKPMDEDAVLRAAKETGAIVTAEEHLEHGGLGSKVARVVAAGFPVPMAFVAIKDAYSKSARASELLQACHLTPQDIEAAAIELLSKKK